jgi:DNA-directed RNA polymerase beta subunit
MAGNALANAKWLRVCCASVARGSRAGRAVRVGTVAMSWKSASRKRSAGWSWRAGAYSFSARSDAEEFPSAGTIPNHECLRALYALEKFNPPLSHHQMSFRHLVECGLPFMAVEHGMIVVESSKQQERHVFVFGLPQVSLPHVTEATGAKRVLTADEALRRRMTYAVNIHISVTHVVLKPVEGHSIAPAGEATGRRSDGLPFGPATAELRALPGLGRVIGASESNPSVWPSASCPHGIPRKSVHVDVDSVPRFGNRASVSELGASPSLFKVGVTVEEHMRIDRVCDWQNALMVSIPAMIGGVCCHSYSDVSSGKLAESALGGHLIIKGAEKVLIPQFKPRENYPMVFPAKSGHSGWVVEIRSRCDSKIRSTSTLVVRLHCGQRGTGNPVSFVKIPFIKEAVPLFAMMRLLGFQSVEECARMIANGGFMDDVREDEPAGRPGAPQYLEGWLVGLLSYGWDVKERPPIDLLGASWEQIVQWVSEDPQRKTDATTRNKYMHHIIANEVLPHMGLDIMAETMERKRRMFAFMIFRLARTALDPVAHPPDDRDHFGNYHVDTTGALIGLLWRQHYRNRIKSMTSAIKLAVDEGKSINIPELLQAKRITDNMTYAFCTGNWGINKGGSNQTGIAQVNKRQNRMTTLSNSRRFQKSANKDAKCPKIRSLNKTSFGLACPTETPDSLACGIMLHFAVSAYVSNGRPFAQVFDGVYGDAHLSRCLMWVGRETREAREACARYALALPFAHPEDRADAESARSSFPTAVFVNGVMVGWTDAPRTFCTRARMLRTSGVIPFDAEIFHHAHNCEVVVSAEAGAMRRPLFVLSAVREARRILASVGDSEPTADHFRQLMEVGAVEFVGKHEEDNIRIKLDASREDDERWDDPQLVRWSESVPPDERASAFAALAPGDAQGLLELVRLHGWAVPGSLRARAAGDAAEGRWDRVRERLVAFFGRAPAQPLRADNLFEWAECVARDAADGSCSDRDEMELARAVLEAAASGVPEPFVRARLLDGSLSSRIVRDAAHVARHADVASDLMALRTDRYFERTAHARTFWRNMKLIRDSICFASETASARKRMPFTHAEIHPTAICSYLSGSIVFGNSNQSPRQTFQAAMVKAANGQVEPDFVNQNTSELSLPERSLVQTVGSRICGAETWPVGINMQVAIMAHRGENQEDSLYLRKGCRDNGAFRSMVTKITMEQGSDVETPGTQVFKVPGDDVEGRKIADYSKLGPMGFVPPGTVVKGGDVLIGRVFFPSDTSVKPRDCSVVLRSGEGTMIVDSIISSVGPNAMRCITMRTRRCDAPERGNKLSSRHGQKGVIGSIMPDEDMPFGTVLHLSRDPADPARVVRKSRTAVQPSILVNVHAITSRMTIGQLLEQALGIVCAERGVIGDGTPFQFGVGPEEIRDMLLANGCNRMGTTRMRSGITGKMMEYEIMVAPMTYQCLKQKAEGKMHARADGPVTALVRQPQEGRQRFGGLKIGEMERDALLAHASSAMLLDRLLESSDAHSTYVCRTCGFLAIPDVYPRSKFAAAAHIVARPSHCRLCGPAGDVVVVRIPYAYKIFLYEQMAIGIAPRLFVEVAAGARFAQAPAAGAAPENFVHTMRQQDRRGTRQDRQ